MTVNYTSLLSLGQPVTGTESGTWGDDVNNAVTSYLDIAIAGTLTLTGDGAVTLANTQGTSVATNIGSTTAQYYILKIVGPLTATKVITAPSASKTYLVINTDSTYGVTVKASGQSGVTVPAGARAVVVFNGTDYVLASSSAPAGSIANNYVTKSNGSGALTASAIYDDGSTVTVGSQFPATPVSLAVNGDVKVNYGPVSGTAVLSLYSNPTAYVPLIASGSTFSINQAGGAGSIGTINIFATTHTWYQYLVPFTEQMRLDSSALKVSVPQITAANGSASAPSYSFNSSGNDDNGMYLSAANEVSLSTAGTKRVTVTSDGRLYGTALHNNAGAVTGTTNQYVASGTYTPTITALLNVTGSTANTAQWTRVGNVVTVSGLFSIDPTAAAYTIFYVSLPIASNLTSVANLGGSGIRLGDTANDSVAIYGDITDDRAVFVFWASDGSNNYLPYTFTYLIA